MPLLGVDVGSTRVHVAIAHDGQVLSVPALDGLPYFLSVIGCSHGHAIVGAPARAHYFVSPDEVVFGPGRFLGDEALQLGDTRYDPVDLVARLLEQAVAAGLVAVRDPIVGAALSRPAWATREARRALTSAAQRAGLNLVRTEVATTLAAVARHTERGPIGLVVFVDVGGWKIEATIVSLEVGVVRAIGRCVDATMGGSWLDQRMVEALVDQLAPGHEEVLLGDQLCYAMLREQCETLRIQLGTESSASVVLPFLMPLIGAKEPPVWQIDRRFLETLSRPLLDALSGVCGAALAHAHIDVGQIGEAFVLGGLAHMPAVRDTVTAFFDRLAAGHDDVDGVVARGAALAAAASLGQLNLRVIDDLDDSGHTVAAAGWGQSAEGAASRTTPTPSPATRTSHTSSQEWQRTPLSQTPTPQAEASVPQVLTEWRRTPTPRAETTLSPHPHTPSQEWLRPPTNPEAQPLQARTLSQEWLRPPTNPNAALPHERTLSQEWLRPPSEAKPAPNAPTPEPALGANTPQPSPPPATPTPQARAQQGTLPSEGTIRNPSDPASLATIPLDGSLPPGAPLSLPSLLLAIGRRRSFSGQLKLKRENHEACIAIVRGGAAGTSLDMEHLRRSFEWPDGTYKITAEPPPARLVPMRQSMVSVVMHGIRSCLRAMDVCQVLDVLAPQLTLAPQMAPARAALVPALGLSPRELRFVEHVLDGTTSMDEILRRGGIGRETAVHIILVLHLFHALEWRAVEVRPGETPADQLRVRAHKLDRADHFEVLGVHWSVSRAEIDHALRRIEEEMRPGGHASQLDARSAERILARARQAHRAVADPGARRAYLLEIHPDLDFDAIESVAEEQNHLYSWRGANEASRETARLKDELLELSRMQHNGAKSPR